MQTPINGEAPVEKEASVREDVALSIGIIAQDEDGRQALFDIGAPDIVKKGYEFEENPGVMQAMECIGASHAPVMLPPHVQPLLHASIVRSH
jgi:hypothetical protein